jgi:DNA-binding response OmpR family regulator
MSSRKRLLVIDDDPDFADGVKSILETAGYDVDVATDPKEGFEALQTGAYDLLLLDILMGRGAEGIAIARKMRKDPQLRELPVLIITGMREQIAFLFPGEPVYPHFVAIDEMVEKPVEPEFLLERVSALLQLAKERKAKTKA